MSDFTVLDGITVDDIPVKFHSEDILTDSFEVDPTLTVSGAAADAKVTGDEIGALKEGLSQEQTGFIVCESGTFYDEDGKTKYINPARIRNIYPISTSGLTSITIPSGYQAWIFRLDKSMNLISPYGSWVVGNISIAFLTTDDTRYINLALRNQTTPSANISDQINIVSNGLIIESTIDSIPEINNKVDGTHGKNLYDKTGVHSIITKGYYRPYSSGGWSTLATYEVVILAVTGGENYAVNLNNTHVCFFTDANASVYKSGFLVNSSNGYTFQIPSDAVTMSLSFAIENEGAFMVEKGTTVSTYEAFKWGVSSDNIIGSANIFNVGNTKLYTTIQSAIDVATNGDIIVIDAGTYNESVDMVGKNLHLIGAGRDSTVIQCAGDDYYYPPLEASQGLIENLSFITTATQKAEGAIDTAYCVHIDYDAEIDGALQFVNCYFESPIRPTVGIGLRENFTLNFTNCKFKSSVFPVYCHEQQANNKTGQRLELIDCSIQSTGATAAIHLQESREYIGNEVTVLMQRCIAKANGVSGNSIILATTYPNTQTPTGSNYLNLNSFYLDSMSALNNESILNA